MPGSSVPRLAERAKRRAVARLLEVGRASEGRYVRALRAISRDVHEKTLAFVLAKTDATLPSDFDLHFAEIVAAVPAKVAPVFERHARQVGDANRKALRVVGVKASDIGLTAEIAKRRDENIQLVMKAEREYAQSVADIFSDPGNFGLSVDDLKSSLLARGDVSESRAELIARDQTLKLNGAITEIRQTNAGVDSYIWSTSLDERVREEHAALEGQTFSWSSPPEVGHPGEDFQCRCVALPVIPELEGL
jgi:SPP1 gp7 family putative phage head morphogenesis protein